MCCLLCSFFFFFKHKTAYELRISDWSSDVCSSDLDAIALDPADQGRDFGFPVPGKVGDGVCRGRVAGIDDRAGAVVVGLAVVDVAIQRMPGRELALAHANHQDLRGDLRLRGALRRSEEHTSELQSLMRISYAV